MIFDKDRIIELFGFGDDERNVEERDNVFEKYFVTKYSHFEFDFDNDGNKIETPPEDKLQAK
jgi:hypothetical protein